MPKSLAVARYAYVFCHASSKKYPTQSASLIFLQFLMNEATGIDCTGMISVITDMGKFDMVEAALNQRIDGNSDLVMETINESITYYSGLQQLSFGVLLIVAVIVVCFSFINLVNTTITNFLSRRQEIGMLQAIGRNSDNLWRDPFMGLSLLCKRKSCYIAKIIPTHILYGEKDNLTAYGTIFEFAQRTNSTLSIMKNGEHWFHTEEQMKFLDEWINKSAQ